MSDADGRTPNGFPAQARQALADPQLRQALRRATDTFAARRANATAEVADWQALRRHAEELKAATLADLGRYVAQFAERAAAAGAAVHWARTADEACAIVQQLATARAATRLVKSKSMATEEIGLNAALAARARDQEPVETDLGEWIVQLAGEAPSHIIVPAIHKSRQAIGQLFVDRLGIPPSDEPKVLAAHARQRLREHFARADLGISGVNFGVAETGTILILENEGNARMTTTLPRTHVAVMGIEKVIPRFLDLEVFLRLLPRAGTGQHLTAYQSLLTGPDPDGQGPQELHIVLLDNGRSRIAADAAMRATLACIRCGACLNACPVYQSVGGHAYGAVYPGPIGAILMPQLLGQANAAPLPFASTLCGACKDVCPVRIDIPALLLELRRRAVTGDAGAGTRAALAERVGWRLWAVAHRRSGRYRAAMALLAVCLRLPLRPLFLLLLRPLRRWRRVRTAPVPAPRPFRATRENRR